jgi:hydrogenase expression/formation protein HypC
MCLGVPGQIIRIVSAREAVVDFWGQRKAVRLDDLSQTVEAGEYIIEHGGYAVRVIPIEDVQDTLALYEVLLTEAGEDPIARDAVEALECPLPIELEEPVLV